jgi:hypothetical protein
LFIGVGEVVEIALVERLKCAIDRRGVLLDGVATLLLLLREHLSLLLRRRARAATATNRKLAVSLLAKQSVSAPALVTGQRGSSEIV